MGISADEVLKVAKLAKLEIAPADVVALSGQLNRIVELVEQLKTVPTEGVQPLAHAMDIHSVLRADIVRSGLSRETALANAPQHDDECFRVPPVM
ncbi:MAG: Asp-tRNA(Asn)/Glu-tRNA(Gln) amidotransferase subunit GatC [Pirellulaceae bacterium]|nr:Asp-tRNA(Asn)/Glu-tRNA(Gln) amidotransferase subunit GatC [Pirellulaceae bacterium]